MLELIFPIGILPSKLYPRVVYSLIHLLCYTRLTLLQCQCHSLSLMPHVSHSSVLFGCFATILHIYNRIKWNTHCPRRYGTNYYQNRRGASWEYCTKFAVVQLLIYSYIAYEIAALVARDVFVAMPSGYSKCLEPFCQYMEHNPPIKLNYIPRWVTACGGVSDDSLMTWILVIK